VKKNAHSLQDHLFTCQLKTTSGGLTDIGRKRKTNQDSILLSPLKGLYLEADGMGGHAAGDKASKMATELFAHEFESLLNKYKQNFTDQLNDLMNDHSGSVSRDNFDLEGLQETLATDSIRQAIKDCFCLIDHSIRLEGQNHDDLRGMGTTLCSLTIHGQTLMLGNVGDSRIYLIQDQTIIQLTRDHSLIQEKIHHQIYAREQAVNDPQKNVIVRSLGVEEAVEVDVFSYRPQKNDFLLLCSDGLFGRVGDQEILGIMNAIHQKEGSIAEKITLMCRALINEANLCGGGDNISAVVVHIDS